MRATFTAMVLALGIASAASAQLAAIDSPGAPGSTEGLRCLDDLASQGARADTALRRDDAVSEGLCRQRAHSFRARNTASPSRRQQELEACLAAVEQRRQLEVAGP